MRSYYTAQQIRDAEAPLLASLPDGVLMRRAAFGLTTAIIRELGTVSGRTVCAVVGSGDNGGDALWAATLLKRRGAGACAVLLNPDKAHPKALAAFRDATLACTTLKNPAVCPGSKAADLTNPTPRQQERLGLADSDRWQPK